MTIITTSEVGTSHLKIASIAIVSEPWEPEQELLPVTLPQDRKTHEREVYQEVNCNGKEMNKKEVNDGTVIGGKGTTGSKGRNYGYS